MKAVDKRLREEWAKLQVEIKQEKSRLVDLSKGESCGCLGFECRWVRSLQGKWRPASTPKLRPRTALVRKLTDLCRRCQSQPIARVIEGSKPILRGWVRYVASGHARRCFGCIKDWVEKKVRRHLRRTRKLRGFGGKRWSNHWLYDTLGLFNPYQGRGAGQAAKALPADTVS